MINVSPQPNNRFWLHLESKRILVVGAGKTGLSAIRFLENRANKVCLWDSREEINVDVNAKLEWSIIGTSASLPWETIDGVVLSPGVSPNHPTLQKAFANNIPVIGDVELFALYINTRDIKPRLIGITGSNGKTTVTLLTEHIIKYTNQSVLAAGNIGTPVLDILALSDTELPDFVVLELSSFQLEMCSSLQLDVACNLNVSEDHLDRHGTLQEYANAKQRIFNNAKSAVFWKDQPATYPRMINQQHCFSFSVSTGANSDWWFNDSGIILYRQQTSFDIHTVQLAGLHNILNIQASAAIAHLLTIQISDIASAVKSFTPPPHRCTRVSNVGDVQWIDDSKATNPGATLAALEGIGPITKGKLLLIAGGDAKGADLSCLAPALSQFVAKTITIGKDAALFNGLAPSQVNVDSLDMAVKMANDLANPGDTVLLSPACASIDMFDNYIHRAQVFMQAIQRWAA